MLVRSTVRNTLLEYGIVAPQANPFNAENSEPSLQSVDSEPDGLISDDLLDPEPSLTPPSNVLHTTSFTGPLSDITDDSLDELIIHLHSNFHRVGLSMLDGMLRRLGHRVPRERI